MRIDALTATNSYNKNNAFNNVNFGYKLAFDIGASNKRGSLKILALTDKGKTIFKEKGFVNNTIKGFDGNNDFLAKLSKKIMKVQDKIQSLKDSGELKLKGKDALLSGLAIFVPGTTYANNKIAFMPNLRDKNDASLENIEFDQFKNDMIAGKNDFKGLKASKKLDLTVTKDLGGCGIALAKILSARKELNEGDYVMGVMTGGGFGSVTIKVKNGIVEFETSESSSYLTGNFEAYKNISSTCEKVANSENPSETIENLKSNNYEELKKEISVIGKLGRQGVSVKSHINTFFNALNRPDLAKIALDAGDARIVEENTMALDKNKNKELIEKIRKQKEFVEIPAKKPENVKFMLDENCFPNGELNEARKIAVNSYANAVSLITINKINDCLNKIILVGPFAHGVNRHIKENPQDYNAKDLPDLIMQKVETNIDKNHADLPSTEKLLKLYDLKIICDENINFDDNTFAGDVLLNKKLNFVQNRGSWFSIPAKSLEKAIKNKG